MLFADEHATVASAMRPKVVPVLKGHTTRIRQAARRPDMASGISQPDRRDLAHPTPRFPKKAHKLLGAADVLPIQSRRAQSDLLVHELLRLEDVQSMLSQQAYGRFDTVFRRTQGAGAIVPTCEGDQGRQSRKRAHHERARQTHRPEPSPFPPELHPVF